MLGVHCVCVGCLCPCIDGSDCGEHSMSVCVGIVGVSVV